MDNTVVGPQTWIAGAISGAEDLAACALAKRARRRCAWQGREHLRCQR